MKRFVLWFFISSSAFYVSAQFGQKEFKKVFDKELDQKTKYTHRENHSGKYHYTRPQQVPDWLVHPPVAAQNEIYAIGVSDPGMDTTQAYEMALFRAKVLANLLHLSTTQLLCDFFLNELEHTSSIVYEHFSRISAQIPKDGGTFSIVETYYNAYDETMVLIKYVPTKKLKKNQADKILLELYKNETESSVHGEYESVYEMQVVPSQKSDSIKAFYQFTEVGTRSDVVSKIGDTIQQIPIYSLIYTGIPSTDSIPTVILSHGLWKELLNSIMAQIISKAREKPENVSYLSDDYQKDSYQKLTRGISVNRQRFVVTSVSKKENKLAVELQELALP